MEAVAIDNTYICIYPAYINNKKSLAEGRRIPKEKCVENPTVNEIKDVCLASSLKAVVENKLYCREMYRGDALVRGRVRVQLQKDDKFANEKIKNKQDLMIYLCDMIPKLKSRIQKTGGATEQTQQKGKKNQKRRR